MGDSRPKESAASNADHDATTRDIAEASRGEAAQKQRLAETVNAFFSHEILGRADPDQVSPERPVTLREAVDLAASKLEGLYADEPLIRAEIHSVLGSSYRGMGSFEEARRHLGAALELRRSALGPEAPETLESVSQLATILRIAGATEEAEPLFRELLDARRRTLGERQPETLSSMAGLADLYLTQGRSQEALPLLEAAYAGQQETLGADHMQTLQTMVGLVHAHQQEKSPERAIEIGERALAQLNATVGPDHPETTNLLGVMGGIHNQLDHHDKAIAMLREADDAERRVLGEDHPHRISTFTTLARMIQESGDSDEAIRLYQQAVKICKESPRIDAGTRANTIGKLGGAFVDAGRLKEAEAPLLESYPILRDTYGPQHYRTRRAAKALVRLYEAWDQPSQATLWRKETGGE